MKNADEWFSLLSDEGKAEIMKTQIVEVEKTKREISTQQELSRREKIGNNNFNIVRMIMWGSLVVITWVVSCSYSSHFESKKDIEELRLKVFELEKFRQQGK